MQIPFFILSNNPLIASLQLFTWLFLRPSAWHRYVTQIDSQLLPDFALASLQRHQWRNPRLWRLLLLSFAIYPLWSGIIIGMVVGITTFSVDATILGVSYGMALTLVGNLMGAITIAVPFALIASVIGGTLLGIIVGISGDLSSHIFTMGVGIFVLGMAGSISDTLSYETNNSYTWARRIGSISLGGIITILMLLLVSYLATFVARQLLDFLLSRLENAFIIFNLAYAILISLFLVVFLSVILKWHGHTWQKSIFWSTLFSVLSGTLVMMILHVETLGFHNLVLIGVVTGTMVGIGASLLFAFPYLFAKRVASNWVGFISGVLVSASVYLFFLELTDNYSLWIKISSSILHDTNTWAVLIKPFTDIYSLKFILLVGVPILLGLTWCWWQAIFLYPFVSAWNLLLYRAEQRRDPATKSLFSWHSVCWDERQHLPLSGLENYLVLLAEHYPTEGQAAIDYVSTTQQRWAAQAAQIELDARRLQNCESVIAISEIHHGAIGELTGPANSLLRSLSSISQDVVAALRQTSPYNQRLVFKEVEERLEGLWRELTRSSEKYAERFRPIVDSWRMIVAARISNHLTEHEGEIENPYVIMLPLTVQQKIFVGRIDISKRIEQFLRQPVCPPLLLYGQRRMGKTSLLKNLVQLLPSSYVPLFVDLQGLASLSRDEIAFFYGLSHEMKFSAQQSGYHLPSLSRDTLNMDPFIGFIEWLDEIEVILKNNKLLLMLDEFETLNQAFVDKRLNESMILGFFRHLIQHRSRLKILLSGSHTLEEFKQWASYLINVQTLHISYLKETETQRLIEQPIADFGLAYTPEASQRVVELTRCHPCLVQMLCYEIVMLKNEQPAKIRWIAQITDIEEAIPMVLNSGSAFFASIEMEQIKPRSLPVLHFLAAQGEKTIVSYAQLAANFPEQLDASLQNLLQRELIEMVEEGYRIQVELIRRWFNPQSVLDGIYSVSLMSEVQPPLNPLLN
jgi:AAA+ ATPase superfamily predicted ATPase